MVETSELTRKYIHDRFMEIDLRNQAFKDELHTRFEQIVDDFTVIEQRQLKIINDIRKGNGSDDEGNDSASVSGSQAVRGEGKESEIDNASGMSQTPSISQKSKSNMSKSKSVSAIDKNASAANSIADAD